MKLKLGQKLLLSIGTVAILLVSTLFGWLTSREEIIFLREIRQRARNYSEHIVLLRHWIADQGGVYVLKKEGIETNPYLKQIPDIQSEITDTDGKIYTLKNPAVATKELSEYAKAAGVALQFRLTSLKYLNPDNAPTEFEQQALLSFQQNKKKEASFIEYKDNTAVYHYIASLYIKKPCLKCHATQGYKVGDVRGGISISIPVYNEIIQFKRNRSLLYLLAVFFNLNIVLLLYLLIRHFVTKPLGILENAAQGFASGMLNQKLELNTGDEIENLASQVQNMAYNLKKYYTELETASNSLEKSQAQMSHIERLSNVGTIVAGVAHELGNPLSNIIYEIENLRDFFIKIDKSDSLKLFETEINRIIDIVEELQGITRPAAKKEKAININKLLASPVFSIFFDKLGRKGIKIDLSLDKQTSMVKADKTKLTQVLINLIRNAENAMPNGGRLRICTAKTKVYFKDENLYKTVVELKICDNGTGIPQDQLTHIFEPFFTTKGAMGTGLGLFISYKSIKEHDGIIEVESTEGEGTVFIIKLPQI